MQAYYLNNFFILKYLDGDYYARLDTLDAGRWIDYAIEQLHRNIMMDGGYNPSFNTWDCFQGIVDELRSDLEDKGADDEAVQIIIGLLRTNHGAIISIAEMDVPYSIDLIGRELVATVYES